MTIKDIFAKASHFDTAARREKLQSPELVQETKAVRHPKSSSNAHIAYCKNDAGSGSTTICYLDTDGTGEEITVYCSIAQGGLDLNEAEPRLINGNWMLVEKIGDYWRCPSIFQPTLDCDCFQE